VIALVERENHAGGATHDLLAFHRAPEAGIETVIAVVAACSNENWMG
jgi:hypothetical protein